MSTDAKEEVKRIDGVKRVQNRENSVVHLDRDPNDPRRNKPAEANISNLNKEDPEKKPGFQNPVV